MYDILVPISMSYVGMLEIFKVLELNSRFFDQGHKCFDYKNKINFSD